MPVQDEVGVGIAQIREEVEKGGLLKVRRSERLSGRLAQYFVVSADKKDVDFVLSHEFLSDLPGTKAYRNFLTEYISELEKRFKQPNPLDFYCLSGTGINITVHWPITPIPNRAGSFVHVDVQDLGMPTLVAKCSLVFEYPVGPTEARNPFARQRAIVNRIRQGIDRQEVAFYARAAHPHELQSLEVWASDEPPSAASETDLEQFVSGKVYWLAFKRADRHAKVWIADPWDAKYLGVEPLALRRAAQIQDARAVLTLDDHDFAGPGQGLLVGSAGFEASGRSSRRTVFFSGASNHAKHIQGLLREVLPESMAVITSDEQQAGGKLTGDVRSLIERADFVVLDVGESANLFFEMGMAQALKKKVLFLVPRQLPPNVPLDLGAVLYLPYDANDLNDLKRNLANYIERYWGLPVAR